MSIKSVKMFICVIAAVSLTQSQVNITGTISDSGTTQGVYGAIVSLIAGGIHTQSDSIGHYALGGSSQVQRQSVSTAMEPASARMMGNRLHFKIANGPTRVCIEAFTLSGKRAGSIADRVFTNGEYSTGLFPAPLSPQVYLLRVRIGESACIFKVQSAGSRVTAGGGLIRHEGNFTMNGNRKAAADADTIVAWAVGYNVAKLPIPSLAGTYDIKLQRTVAPGSAQVVQTAQSADLLAAKPALTFANDDGSAIPTVTVDTTQKFQTILGFGGAFTEATAYNLQKTSAQNRASVLNNYFNPYTGSGYTVCRTHLQSCDFCVANYSYDNVANDFTLDNFSMQHESQWMIPTIKEAMNVTGTDIRIFASPWSPSAWMKSNNNMLNGGTLLATCEDAWALMYVKYVQEMKNNGISIWGLTIQNEPEATQTWESCIYTPATERDFLKSHLGPALALNKVDVKVMIWDHNKDHIVTWANTIFSDTAAAKYAWGTAFHWYTGDGFDNVGTTHANFPAKHLLATEEAGGLPMYNWGLAQSYAHDIIGDLNNWTEGWVEWNLVLNQNGLPRHDPNTGCASSVYIDSNNDSVHYNPSYYVIAQFSKYLRPGAVRVGCASSQTTLEATAFRNQDGRIVVVAYNNSAAAVSFKIKQGSQIVKPTIPAHGIADFVY
ncbi:MAG TPA: glycoside hydrolase family 30 protein [Chitinivibrionales bacterium]|nr:glycoside hydrolase family 30 protein [Chitinivibrionales bacterium]